MPPVTIKSNHAASKCKQSGTWFSSGFCFFKFCTFLHIYSRVLQSHSGDNVKRNTVPAGMSFSAATVVENFTQRWLLCKECQLGWRTSWAGWDPFALLANASSLPFSGSNWHTKAWPLASRPEAQGLCCFGQGTKPTWFGSGNDWWPNGTLPALMWYL